MAKKQRTLDRERFVRWTLMAGHLNTYILKGAVNNLIKGTEHIVDIDGLLKYVNRVPGYLFDDVLDSAWIPTNTIILVYNKPDKDYEKSLPKDIS
jgi:hypothetical protein